MFVCRNIAVIVLHHCVCGISMYDTMYSIVSYIVILNLLTERHSISEWEVTCMRLAFRFLFKLVLTHRGIQHTTSIGGIVQ